MVTASAGSLGVGAAQPASAPLTPSQRIDAIDVLRGLALFGVLAINLVTEFRVSVFEQFLPAANAGSPLDRGVEAALMAELGCAKAPLGVAAWLTRA